MFGLDVKTGGKMKHDEIKEKAMQEIETKLNSIPDCEKGIYFHGWFDCLYFVSTILKE